MSVKIRSQPPQLRVGLFQDQLKPLQGIRREDRIVFDHVQVDVRSSGSVEELEVSEPKPQGAGIKLRWVLVRHGATVHRRDPSIP